MSTAGGELRSAGRAAIWSAWGFIALLATAVLWPAPVIWINDATVDVPIAVHEDSFLGREAPSWDLVFWGIAGLFVLVLIHIRLDSLELGFKTFVRDVKRLWRALPRVPKHMHPKKALALLIAGTAVVTVVWLYLDAPLIGLTESLQSDGTRLATRLLNRLGGGFNPPLVAIYFAVAGLLFVRPRWTELFICMLLAGGVAGGVVQILKFLFGRSRPELWLGPFHHTWPSATSFPSGHTVGAFAIASVIFFGAKSRLLRIVAMVLAIGIAMSRVFAFRHWPSDVVASAILGTWFGWLFTEALLGAEEEAEGANGVR